MAGAAGAAGPAGATGPTGPIGTAGVAGAVGAAGPAGATGPTGPSGISATAPAAYGTYRVTDRGTVGDYTLNLQQGSLSVSNSTFVSLIAGSTYELSADIAVRCLFAVFSWQTEAGVTLGNNGQSFSTNANDPGVTTPAFAVFTPTANTRVKLRLIAISGYSVTSTDVGQISIKEMTAQGPAGPTGTAGAAGAAGAAGPAGATGPTGPIGTAGGAGAAGPAGPAGATGPTGPIGTAGSAGLIGPTGPAGSGSNPPAFTFAGYMNWTDQSVFHTLPVMDWQNYDYEATLQMEQLLGEQFVYLYWNGTNAATWEGEFVYMTNVALFGSGTDQPVPYQMINRADAVTFLPGTNSRGSAVRDMILTMRFRGISQNRFSVVLVGRPQVYYTTAQNGVSPPTGWGGLQRATYSVTGNNANWAPQTIRIFNPAGNKPVKMTWNRINKISAA